MDPVHAVHRWMRWNPGGPEANHWCIDGDTDHHLEPCDDAANHAGDHANDVTTVDDWPVFSL